MWTDLERETVVTASAGDALTYIWTAQRAHITAMKKHPAFTLVNEGTNEDGQPWAFFSVPRADWNPATGGRRRRDMTDEQRQALSDRAKRNFGPQPNQLTQGETA